MKFIFQACRILALILLYGYYGIRKNGRRTGIMSDEIKHECGVALLRLRKDLNYYRRKYGTVYYGYHKLSLLLEKQHNRGQDGAGIAALGLDVEPGRPYYQLEKSNRDLPLADLLERIGGEIEEALQAGIFWNGSGARSKRRCKRGRAAAADASPRSLCRSAGNSISAICVTGRSGTARFRPAIRSRASAPAATIRCFSRETSI